MALLNHSWPGNVRELQNVVRNAVILNEGEIIEPGMLSIAGGGMAVAAARKASTAKAGGDGPELKIHLGRPWDEIERDIVEASIRHCEGSIPRAAEMLQVSPSTIYRKKEGWQKQ